MTTFTKEDLIALLVDPTTSTEVRRLAADMLYTLGGRDAVAALISKQVAA
jgi:hypothetical protein